MDSCPKLPFHLWVHLSFSRSLLSFIHQLFHPSVSPFFQSILHSSIKPGFRPHTSPVSFDPFIHPSIHPFIHSLIHSFILEHSSNRVEPDWCPAWLPCS